MKRKFLMTFLSLSGAVACTIGLAACNDNNEQSAHTHNWAQTWETDETHHWHNCASSGCTVTDNSQKDGYAEHDFSNGECVCGYKPSFTVGLKYKLSSDSYVVTGIGTAKDSNIIIPSEYEGKPVTEIDGSAFSGCSSITSIVLPNSITGIGRSAFEGCSSLTSINIPDEVTVIGISAFKDCSSITEIALPDGIPFIAESTFDGCSSLASIVIPDSVTIISTSAFSGCSKLAEITIPETVTRLGNNVFRDCSSLTSIVIPNGITTLYDNTFNGCSSLKSIVIPDSVTTVYSDVFAGCPIETATVPSIICSEINNPSLKTLVITSGERIYDNALENCDNLTDVTIPDSVTYIGEMAFYNCKMLKNITFNGTKEQWNSINVGSNWSYMTGDFTVHCTNGEIEY